MSDRGKMRRFLVRPNTIKILELDEHGKPIAQAPIKKKPQNARKTDRRGPK